MNHPIKTMLLTSLSKVFAHTTPTDPLTYSPSIFKNESFNFQVAYTLGHMTTEESQFCSISIDSALASHINICSVGLVPSELPAFARHDEDYITTSPGLFPDVLYPLTESKVKVLAKQWRSLWFEVKGIDELPCGEFPITIHFKNNDGEVIAFESFTLKILDACLPKQRLLHTEWFHVDCLSDYYHTEIFSDRHWELIKAYLQTAASHGVNMILTPLFTPPLDTEVGGERPTVQLVDVTISEGIYSFGFDKLAKWINICKEVGIEYFEMSHLFTQWGATSIPKIMATIDGVYKKLFGWENSALENEYKVFLNTFIPELITFIKDQELEKKCYFHISDEPTLDHLQSYQKAKDLVRDLLKDFPIIDALSDLDFYKTGAIEKPIPANDHIAPFIEAGVPNLWVYYCCSQCQNVSNRFMSMPSTRNRIIATQLFKYDIEGFLHWGYNFWNTQYSKAKINPFLVTEAGTAFPSGDSDLVDPGDHGPIESIRLKVFTEALCDLRAMEMLASLTSKEYVMELMEGDLAQPITFSQYPKTQDYLLNLRYRINEEIDKALSK